MTCAPAGMSAAFVTTDLILSPSITTMALDHSLPFASHSFPNLTALTGCGACAAAMPAKSKVSERTVRMVFMDARFSRLTASKFLVHSPSESNAQGKISPDTAAGEQKET